MNVIELMEYLADIAPDDICCGTCGSWTDYKDALDGYCVLCRYSKSEVA